MDVNQKYTSLLNEQMVKIGKIGNILRKLRKDGIIQNETKGNVSNWSLVK